MISMALLALRGRISQTLIEDASGDRGKQGQSQKVRCAEAVVDVYAG